MRAIKKILLFLGPILLLAGCGQTDEAEEAYIKEVYYLNTTETGVEMHEYVVSSLDAGEQVQELIEQLSTFPAKLEYKPPLQMGFRLLSYRIEGERIILDVSEEYRNLSATSEVLVRAALVRTFCQVDGIKYVSMTVEGGQLYDNLGNTIGYMWAEQFLDNAGDEIAAYEQVSLKLYFANEDGTALIATSRTLAYNTNIPMEKLVIEQLLLGPGTDVANVVYPTVNPAAKLLSISVNDGICYVNFDENFLNQIYNVSSEVAIYSIVDSLMELQGVNHVKISVNGETSVMYRESISLDTVFDRNLDIVTTVE